MSDTFDLAKYASKPYICSDKDRDVLISALHDAAMRDDRVAAEALKKRNTYRRLKDAASARVFDRQAAQAAQRASIAWSLLNLVEATEHVAVGTVGL